MKKKTKTCLQPLAAAALLLLGPALPAQAQYYDYSGVVMTSPADLFPINVFNAALDLRPNMLFVGVGAAGSFSAFAGSYLQAGNLVLGTSGSGNGSFSLEGNFESSTSALVQLKGTGVRLDVGSWGTGSMTVSQGAIFDAALDISACTTGCFNTIGNAAGSTGTLTVTGAGSEVRLAGGFSVGQTSLTTVAGGGSFDFGTAGGETNATVDVLNGGKLSTQNTVVANQNAAPPYALGTEVAKGTVTISGAGSQWIVSRNSVNNSAALLSIGSGARSDGLVTVSNGGKLHVDGNLIVDGSASSGPNDGINIGSNGLGKLVVTGAGSQVLSSGVNAFINVGANNALGNGTFEILAGASASTLYVNVGRNGGTGTMTIGGGSQFTQSGVGSNQAPGANGAAFTHIGRNTVGVGGGGTGTVTVSGGSTWLITDGGGDGRASEGSPGIALGRGAGSSGTLTITGAGSKVEIRSTSLNLAPGVADNYNPFVGLGYDNPTTSSGTLMISAGGQLIMTGNAVSTVANPRTTGLNIGGRGDAAPGKGTATVTGAGSKISLTGSDAFIGVGRGVLGGQLGDGTLNVLDQALVESTSLVIGNIGIGKMTVDNASVALSGYRTNTALTVGAGMNVGRSGDGTLTMLNGASITITPSVYTSGFTIAGDSFGSGGTGAVTMSGGSSVVFGGSLVGNSFSVARTGNGTLTMSGGSSIDMGTLNLADFGRDTGGVANATLSSGSWLRANQIQVGGNGDVNPGGSATVTVTGLGSELRADGDTARVSVGRGGTGNLTVSNQAKVSGTLFNVGRAATGNGTLLANNALIELSGQKNLSGTDFGAAMSVGTRGGIGLATITNGSTVNITNLGSAGAALSLGGNPDNPLGIGTLNVSGGSQVKLQAASGLANVRVGHDGTGTLNLAGGSSLDAGDGNVYVATQAGSTGTLNLTGNSTLTAGFVGIGVSAKYDGVAQASGGTGKLVLNNSTLRTAGFELGAGSILTGDGGTIEIVPSSGDVVIGGTIAPGNSPGRIRIRCNIIMLPGSRIVLEVQGSGDFYEIDELIIDGLSTFNLASAQIEFSFLGDTNPNDFAAMGGMNLDNFFRSEIGNTTTGLSQVFAPGQTWANVVNTSTITAVSESSEFSNINITYTSDGNMNVVAVPEPSTWGMLFFGLCAVGAVARRHKAQAAQA